MIGKNFVFNGNSIPYTTAEGASAGWLVDFDWLTPEQRNSQISRQDFHGVISNPTFMEGRLIEISGQIFNTSKLSRGTIRKTVQDIFKFESFPDEGTEFKTLSFLDDDGTSWFIMCKMYRALEFSNERADPIIQFNGELFAQDPIIRGSSIVTASGYYGRIGGVTLEDMLPFSMDEAIGAFSGTNSGNIAAATKVTISADTGTIVNPKIMNYTNRKFYKVNTTLAIGEQLIIDSGILGGTPSVTKIDVFGESTAVDYLRASGSNLIYANAGANQFLLIGDDFDIDDQEKVSVSVQFYNSRQ